MNLLARYSSIVGLLLVIFAADALNFHVLPLGFEGAIFYGGVAFTLSVAFSATAAIAAMIGWGSGKSCSAHKISLIIGITSLAIAATLATAARAQLSSKHALQRMSPSLRAVAVTELRCWTANG